MKSEDIEYGDEAAEYIQHLFPASVVTSAIFQATIDSGRLILPEVFVCFDSRPAGAERIISAHIDSFIRDIAGRHGAIYRPTLRRIIIDEVASPGRWPPADDWY